MNPEDLDLPQPPEGLLDPQLPWDYVRPQSRLWNILKARLTGRPTNGENYFSFVNITESEADTLIENLKKDPRGYPSMDQTSDDSNIEEKYERWLVEEYLEKPFRKKVDQKIEDAQVQSRLKEILESRKLKSSPNIKPQESLIKSAIEDPWSGSYVPSSQIKIVMNNESKPVLMLPPSKETPNEEPVEVEAEKLDIPQVKEKIKKTYEISPISLPKKLPQDLAKNFSSLNDQLDGVARELSAQTILLRQRKFQTRRIAEQLSAIEELIQNQVENYREAIEDLDYQEIEVKDNLDNIIEDFFPDTEEQIQPPTPEPPKEPEPQKQWWEFWKPDSPTKQASGGITPTSPFVNPDEIIQPGVYDDPTVGYLPAGSAVIPENRNIGKKILNMYDYHRYMQALAEALTQPMKAAIAGTAAKLDETIRGLGAFAPFFGGSLDSLINPLSSILDISSEESKQLLYGHENYENEFISSWPKIFKANDWIFPGGTGAGGGGGDQLKGEVFKDILTIGEKGEGLRMFGGTNVGDMPAWIPFPKSEMNKLEYSSGFGFRWYKQHTGIDLAGEPGIKIISPFAGKVSRVDNDTDGSGYGKYVEIEHTQPKIFTFYGHMQRIAAGMNRGESVQAGQLIGELGNSGSSTGPHLHWEVREKSGGSQIDPVPFTRKFKPGGGQPPRKRLQDYPEYKLNGDNGPPGTIVRMGNKLFKMLDRDRLGDEVPLESGGNIIQNYTVKGKNTPQTQMISLPSKDSLMYVKDISEDFVMSPIVKEQFIIPRKLEEYVIPIFESIKAIAAPPNKPVDIKRPSRPEITTTNLEKDRPQIYTTVKQYQLPTVPMPSPQKGTTKILRSSIPTAAVQKCIHERRL